MSYRSRLYNHRNAQPGESAEEKKPFFSKQHDSVQNPSKGAFFQPKLAVNKPGDQFEQEADRVADTVVNKRNAGSMTQQAGISSVQRLATTSEEEVVGTNDQRMDRDKEKPFQRATADPHKEKEKPVQKMDDAGKDKEKKIQKMDDPAKDKEKKIQKKDAAGPSGGGSLSASVASKIESTSGKGSKLPKNTLREMSSAFGVDFSDVNIHKDSTAGQMNDELNAKAFTHGKDIYFNKGNYDTSTREGKMLLAHELTHVVQQNEALQEQSIQRKMGDGHDLVSGQLAGDPTLEDVFDGEKVLKTNALQHESVRKIQQALIDLGFPLPQFGADGSYGDETTGAVKKYQKSKGLDPSEIDGRVGKQTIGLMDADLPAKQPDNKASADLPATDKIETVKPGELDPDGKEKQKPDLKTTTTATAKQDVKTVTPEDPEKLFSITVEVDARHDWLLAHHEPLKLSLCDDAIIQLGGKINVGIKLDAAGRFILLSEPELDVNLVPALCGSNPGVTAQINLLKFVILKNILEADLVGVFGLPDKWATGQGDVPISGGFQGKLQWTPFGGGKSSFKNLKIGIFLETVGQQGVPGSDNGWSVGGGGFIGHDFDFGPDK